MASNPGETCEKYGSKCETSSPGRCQPLPQHLPMDPNIEQASETSSVNPPAGAFPGAGFPPNPFNFSAMSGLLNDPNIKELAEQIAKDPAFNQMASELQRSFQGSTTGQEIPQFDPQ